MSEAAVVRLVLGEDNALLREGMRGLLGAADDIEVVASCADLHSLRESVDALSPDVVLTDIRMPPSWSDEGVQIARHCRAHHPSTGVVLLSQYVDPGYVRSLLDSGSAGRGYLLKERVADVDELVSAIRAVADGGSVVDPQVIEHLVKAGISRGDRNVGRLSARELEVLAEMSRGQSNAAIAASLFITQRAVEKHINSIFAKLGVAGADGAHPRVRAVLMYLSGSLS
jgi:DNA-binding NarL/FixJ family response regulator